jgi:hypothetical protein
VSTRDWSDVNARLRETLVRDLRVSLPCTVESYDASKGKVSVQPGLRELQEGDDGTLVPLRPSPITNVPVHFPGAGGFRITFPIQKGDTGYVIFSDRSLDRWLAGRGEEIDLDDERCHDITDAIAFEPGIRPFGNPWTGAHADHLTIGKDGGLQVFFQSTEISLGEANAAYAVALAESVKAELDAIRAQFDTHTHTGGLPGPGVTGVPVVPFGGPSGSVGSTTVKVKG